MSRRWSWALALPMAMAVSSPLHCQTSNTAKQTEAVPEYKPNTGDTWIDARLKDINVYAARYPDAFADEVSRYLGASRGYVVALSGAPGWTAGDVYFACALATTLAQSCRSVVRARAQNSAGGWNGVARRVLGQRNAMPVNEIRALIRRSYAHWARPLPR